MAELTDAQLGALLDLALDYFRSRKVSDFISVDAVLPAVDAATTPERVGSFHSRVLVPQRKRLLARADKSAVKLGAWVSDGVRDVVADELGKPAHLPKKMVEQMVGSENVRDEVRAMLQDTISGFIKRALGGDDDQKGGAAGLRGALGRSALGFAAVGKGLLGGVGDQLQKQLQDKVRDFVDGSVAALQARIVDKLTSEDTAKMLGKRRRAVFLETLERTEAQVAKSIAHAKPEQLDPLVPALVGHNVARAELRDAIVDEVREVVAELSKQTIGELLDEYGLSSHARDWLHRHGLPIAREFVRTPAFDAWWAVAKAT